MDSNEAVAALTNLGIWDPFAVALIRHDGRCAYCDRDLVGKRLAYACAQTDHLLPQSRFPDLADHPDNWVLSCSVCNGAKRDWVPDIAEMRGPVHVRTRNAKDRLENEADRSDLIVRARGFIRRRTNYMRWNRDWKAVRKIVRGS